jgi:hypothetical protein
LLHNKAEFLFFNPFRLKIFYFFIGKI